MVFIFLSFNIITNTFSNYFTVVNKSEKIAVAKWNVQAEFSDNTINIVLGNEITSYNIKVINKSEIASDYFIIISNLPNDIEVALDDNLFQKANEKNQIKFNAGSLNPNEEYYHQLYFKSSLNSFDLFEYPVKIEVLFVQKEGDCK